MTTKLRGQVRDFHLKFGHPVNETPTVPSQDQIRFRLKLITEEYFELLASSVALGDPAEARIFLDARRTIQESLEEAKFEVDLPEFIDALGDLDYVNEGTRLVFGVDGEPIADEIQRANMDKDAVYVQSKDGYHMGSSIKPTKPATWKGPQIGDVLKKQGWMG